MTGTANQQNGVIAVLDSFNTVAAKAAYKTYFNFCINQAVFTGTDTKKRWNKKNYGLGKTVF